ncbi:hypothetical protein EV659_10473 [Rhodothalassium salexigens DSM 2132]|uniref:Tetratricopeptide repeat protein n=1 Tax=Rhodothalassium salexigens DSM 2132 TaxID=1188247 RepID=A0A4R2PIC9_RHOSA|nr:hypothetical protein [Rhodothalassium salexigens]MBB4211301.1 tetratricopeptide (TPR) repeat protein [Rhodothalassium salexigens DSM 2132]MBK1639375.1 hypothetical protein [Rhodothalassium salexigens DSM 2132]TCP35223.1 hypothetical protein EV659_10473 [Rhodothalassium salexigens DSM 2132]
MARRRLRAKAVRAAVAVVLAAAMATTAAQAQPPRTTNFLSPRVHEQLEAVHAAMARDDYDAAGRLLDAIAKRKTSAFEAAVVWRTRGYIAAQREDYRTAIAAFAKAVDSGVLEARAANDLMFNIGQLHMALDAVAPAIQWLERWRAAEAVPSNQGLMTLAMAYAQAERLPPALDAARAALTNGQRPQASWYGFAAGVAIRLERWQTAERWLAQGVLLYPDARRLWVHLASLHAETGAYDKALATLQLAEARGLLDQPNEIRFLTQLTVNERVPVLGAQVLHQTLAGDAEPAGSEAADTAPTDPGAADSGAGDSGGAGSGAGDTAAALDLLSSAWSAARETDKARAALVRAAPKVGHGRLWFRLGQLRLGDEDWAGAADAFARALAGGDLTNPGAAELNYGIALARAGRPDAALAALRRARDHAGVAAMAETWIADLAAGRTLD